MSSVIFSVAKGKGIYVTVLIRKLLLTSFCGVLFLGFEGSKYGMAYNDIIFCLKSRHEPL